MPPEHPTLQVRLVQAASSLDPEQNRARLRDLLAHAEPGELVVLPEAFARDFGSPDTDLGAFAEDLDGPFVRALEDVAAERRVTVVAGMFRRSDDPARPFNTLVVRGGTSAEYDKIHLYDSFGYRESDRLTAGAWRPVVVEIGGFRVGLMTCYDLRFPELARALVAAGAEVLVVPAAWVAGERKREHWRTLLHARAIENVSYVVGVGQPEPRYTGSSMVVSPLGDTVVELSGGECGVTATLDGGEIERARDVNPSLANRRG